MPIQGVEQPDYFIIDDTLRLRKFDGRFDFALPWYQDLETVWLVDGDEELYTEETLAKMFAFLNEMGELYFIEVCLDGSFQPIGDITFCKEDLPIVIGEKSFRGKGIGSKVVAKLIERARELGYQELEVEDIYSWNIGSQKLLTRLAFSPSVKQQMGCVIS